MTALAKGEFWSECSEQNVRFLERFLGNPEWSYRGTYMGTHIFEVDDLPEESDIEQ